MKPRLLFLIRYFFFWICLFILAKLLFLLYQHNQSFSLSFKTWVSIFMHGLKLDFSATGYFALFPAVILMVTSFNKYKPIYYLINIYTVIMIVFFLLVTFIDLEVYRYWGIHLDSDPLRFLVKPKEALASTNFATLILYFFSLLALTSLLSLLCTRFITIKLKNTEPPRFWGLIAFSFATALLIVPIRGGFGVSPVNTGSVYFSKNSFANHSAVNVVWNFGQSLFEEKKTKNPYIFSNDKDFADRLIQLYKSGEYTGNVLNTAKPNILLLILESFSAKLVEPLGGTKGITPQFNELCKNGILFTEIYATNSRTDKGLATIISGYPVLDDIPILKYPEKTQNLPFLSKSLIQNGYHASFLYGGDVDFANIRSYLINGEFSHITSDNDFASSDLSGKWGAPDHVAFDKFLSDIKADTGQWFKVLLTLSNHEPFEIPGHPRFGNKSLTDRFYSSAYYADSCLGDFIHKFKQTGLWDNTLIIMVADHGTRLPEFDEFFKPRKHHIPMLWTGGAVSKDTIVTKMGSQADLAVTVLRQLGLPSEEYILGKDLLSPSSNSFAFYSLKNGIAMVTDSSGFGYDFTNNSFAFTAGKVDTMHVQIAKSLQQFIFNNYINLSNK